MRRGIDLSDERFGRLIAVKQVPNPKGTGALWECVCDCGTNKVIKGQALTSGATKSCGCFNADRRIELATTHGLASHELYRTWVSMMHRCHNPKDKDYPEYGGRGIVVCARWHDIANFIADVGTRPDGMTLDRRNNNRSYSPRNVRWATRLEQGSNKRNNNSGMVNGERMCIARAAREYGLTESTIRRRMDSGLSMEQAVTMRVRTYNRS